MAGHWCRGIIASIAVAILMTLVLVNLLYPMVYTIMVLYIAVAADLEDLISVKTHDALYIQGQLKLPLGIDCILVY